MIRRVPRRAMPPCVPTTTVIDSTTVVVKELRARTQTQRARIAHHVGAVDARRPARSAKSTRPWPGATNPPTPPCRPWCIASRPRARCARTKKIGNAHVFEATTSRASVQTRLLKELLGLFGGNARPVMAHLVEMGKMSHEDIEDAQKLLDASRKPAAGRARAANEPRAVRPPVAIDAVRRRDLVDHAGAARAIPPPCATACGCSRRSNSWCRFRCCICLGATAGLLAPVESQPTFLDAAIAGGRSGDVARALSLRAAPASPLAAAVAGRPGVRGHAGGRAALVARLARRAICYPGRRGRRRAHRRTSTSRTPTSSLRWRAYFIRWCCCRPRCSGDSNPATRGGTGARTRTHRAARQSQGARCIGWSRRCSGSTRWCGSSARGCAKSANMPATRRCWHADTIRRTTPRASSTVCRHCATAHSTHAVAALAGDLTQRIRQILAGTPATFAGFHQVTRTCRAARWLLALVPLIAGAMDDVARRRAVMLRSHARALQDAVIVVSPLARDDGARARVDAAGNEVTIRNSSLRELVALAYGVRTAPGRRWR